MSNLDKLKQIIQAANPEIMELKFGCEGRDRNGIWIKTHDGWQKKEGRGWSLFEPLEILGRPIRLADVFVAIAKANIKDEFDDWASVEVNQTGMFISDIYNWEEEPIFWNLKNDDLSHQSEETIKFLGQLLLNEEKYDLLYDTPSEEIQVKLKKMI